MFLKNVTTYVGTNLVSQIASVAREFVIRALIPPYLLGVWTMSMVVHDFANTFEIGIIPAAFRELPILDGANDRLEEMRVRSTTFWSRIAQGLLLSAGIVVYTVVYRGKYDRLQLFALGTAAFLVILTSINESFLSFFQAAQKYVSLSKLLLAFSLWQAITLPVGAAVGGVTGLIVAYALSFTVQAALLYWIGSRENLRIEKAWEWSRFKRLLSYGLPLRVVDYPLQIFPMLDVLLIGRYLGVGPLAIYATARAVLTQGQEIISRIGSVMLTRMFNLSGAQAERAYLAEELKRFLMVNYLVTIPIIIVVGNLGVGLLVPYLLPKYAAAVGVVRILLFALFFTPQTTLLRNFWMLDKNLIAVGISNVVGFAGITASLIVARLTTGFRLETIAFAMVAGYSIYSLYVIFSIGREVWGTARTLNFMCYLALSVLYTSVVIFMIGGREPGKDLASAFQTMAAMIVYSLLLIAPLVFVGLWKSGSLAYLRENKQL